MEQIGYLALVATNTLQPAPDCLASQAKWFSFSFIFRFIVEFAPNDGYGICSY